MKKTCSNCNNWKRYIRLDNRCHCSILSGGNYSEMYTNAKDTCKHWDKFNLNFNIDKIGNA